MAVTDINISHLAGVNFNRRMSSKEFALGTVAMGTNNTIWMYVIATEDVATGTCTVATDGSFGLTDTGGIYTADTAFLSGEYGWVRRTTPNLTADLT